MQSSCTVRYSSRPIGLPPTLWLCAVMLRMACAKLVGLDVGRILFWMERDEDAVGGALDVSVDHSVSDAADGVSGSVDQVVEDPGYLEHPLRWQGIDIVVRYNPCWLGRCGGVHTHHIEVVSADRAPLPITETDGVDAPSQHRAMLG